MRLPLPAQGRASTSKGPLSVLQMSLDINHHGRYRGPQQRANRFTSVKSPSAYVTEAIS